MTYDTCSNISRWLNTNWQTEFSKHRANSLITVINSCLAVSFIGTLPYTGLNWCIGWPWGIAKKCTSRVRMIDCGSMDLDYHNSIDHRKNKTSEEEIHVVCCQKRMLTMCHIKQRWRNVEQKKSNKCILISIIISLEANHKRPIVWEKLQ